jgi:hypothetical protein
MVNFVLNGQWDVTGIAPDGKEMHLNGTVPGSALNDVLCSGFENIKYQNARNSRNQRGK